MERNLDKSTNGSLDGHPSCKPEIARNGSDSGVDYGTVESTTEAMQAGHAIHLATSDIEVDAILNDECDEAEEELLPPTDSATM
jgi:hypothetical protein